MFYISHSNPHSNLHRNYDRVEICALAGVEPGALYDDEDRAALVAEALSVAAWKYYHTGDNKRGYRAPDEFGATFHVREATPEILAEYKWRQDFTWIDPKDVSTETVDFYGAVKIASSHKSVPFYRVCHSTHLEHIDGKDWELIRINLMAVVNGKRVYWGMFVEGLGLFNQMVVEENFRLLTDAEKAAYSGARMSMSGWHSGKHSFDFNLGEIK